MTALTTLTLMELHVVHYHISTNSLVTSEIFEVYMARHSGELQKCAAHVFNQMI